MVWTPEFLTHRFTPDHPMNPVRLHLTIRLAGELGVLEGVELLEPEPALDAELERVHVPSYLEAVRVAPVKGDDPAHGLGTDDNPIFEGMHEASCLVCGGSLRAARGGGVCGECGAAARHRGRGLVAGLSSTPRPTSATTIVRWPSTDSRRFWVVGGAGPVPGPVRPRGPVVRGGWFGGWR